MGTRNIIRIFSAAALLLAGGGLAADPRPPAVMTAVPYVKDAGPEQVLDFYWTATPPKATVLFIHGGSLEEAGERRTSPAYRNVCRPFVAAAIACATMDYRLAPSFAWPAMPNDVAAAIVKVRELIVKRGGDPHQLFVFGHSSGCLLTAVVGTNPAFLEAVGLAPSDLAGIIPMGCTLDPYDVELRKLNADALREPFSHDKQEAAKYGSVENWLAANPSRFVGPHVPPALVIVAQKERFMPPVLEEGSRFVRRLLEEGVIADLVEVPGTHMKSISSIGKPHDPTFAAIQAFITHPTAASSN